MEPAIRSLVYNQVNLEIIETLALELTLGVSQRLKVHYFLNHSLGFQLGILSSEGTHFFSVCIRLLSHNYLQMEPTQHVSMFPEFDLASKYPDSVIYPLKLLS
ncbi:hypothetical protein Tco_0528457 [Tanacetum coccineum]